MKKERLKDINIDFFKFIEINFKILNLVLLVRYYIKKNIYSLIFRIIIFYVV